MRTLASRSCRPFVAQVRSLHPPTHTGSTQIHGPRPATLALELAQCRSNLLIKAKVPHEDNWVRWHKFVHGMFLSGGFKLKLHQWPTRETGSLACRLPSYDSRCQNFELTSNRPFFDLRLFHIIRHSDGSAIADQRPGRIIVARWSKNTRSPLAQPWRKDVLHTRRSDVQRVRLNTILHEGMPIM